MSQFSEGDAAITRLTAATDAFEKVLTEPEGTIVPMPVGQPQTSLAERLKRALDAVTVQPAQAAAQAEAAAQQALQSAAAAAQSAAEAGSSAAATGYVAPPFPDMWAPLSDDLKMIAGYPVNTKLISFSRASTATYIDKSGVLQTAAVNEARFEKEGLLIEGQSTNMFLYSGDQNNTYWSKTRVTVTTGFTAPDGSTNAIKMVASTDPISAHYISKPLAVVAGNAYTLSFFVKAGEYTKCRLNFSGSITTDNMSCDFDLAAGSATSATGVGNPTITALTDGWYRISATSEVVASAGALSCNIWIMDGNTTTLTGDGVKGLYVWGAQLETGTVPSSYIPTAGAAVTRATDDCTSPRSGNDNYFGPVTIAAEVHCNGQTATDGATSSRRGILAAYPTTNDNIILMVDSSSSTAGKYAFAYGSATFNYSDNRIDDGQIHTVCSRSTTSQNQSCVDGTLLTSPTSVSRPTPGTTSSVNQLFYIGRGAGATASGSRMLNGHIRNLRIWHRALSDIQIKGLR